MGRAGDSTAADGPVARPGGARAPSPAVRDLLEQESRQGLAELSTYRDFAGRIEAIKYDLVTLLQRLRADGKRVVGYGATSRSATVTNYCDVGPDLVQFVCDSTPEKQGRLSPGSGIPVRPQEEFSRPYPDYALLFAWNHAEEIMANEREFSEQGERWIRYVPSASVR